GRVGRWRRDLFEQLRDPRRPATELGPPVSQEAVSDHQAERQRCPWSPKRFIWQFEHFDLPSIRRWSKALAFPPLVCGHVPREGQPSPWRGRQTSRDLLTLSTNPVASRRP